MIYESYVEYDDKLKFTPDIQHVKSALSSSDRDEKSCKKIDIVNAPNFPTVLELAQFASAAYDTKNEQEEWSTKGWTLLTVAENDDKKNGYRGSAFYHKDHKHIVIAHRGTVCSNLKEIIQNIIISDLGGVVCGKYVPQMMSAITFVHMILEILLKIEKESRIHFEVFITGHSLGGWLAQITTYTSKYLRLENRKFVNYLSSHCHIDTVVFDSPGCWKALLTLHGMRHSNVESHVGTLNITTFISGPSKINSINEHVGTIYEISKDLNKHGIKFIIEKLKRIPSRSHMLQVVDWPKYVPLFGSELKRAQRARKNGEQENIEVRYKVREVDENECSVNVFSELEQNFLSKFKCLLDFPQFLKDIFSECFSSADHIRVIKRKLSAYYIHDGFFKLQSPSESLDNFVPFLRRLGKLCPDFFRKTIDFFKPNEIKREVYRKYSSKFISKYIDNFPLKFKEVDAVTVKLLDGCPYMEPRVVPTGNTHLKISQILNYLRHTYKAKTVDCSTILELNQLLYSHEAINLWDYLSTVDDEFFLIIDCQTIDLSITEILNEKKPFNGNEKKIKIILVTNANDERTADLLTRVEGIHKLEVNDSFAWADLCEDTQASILGMEVNFQGKTTSVEDLIESTDAATIGEVLDGESIISLVANKSSGKKTVSIGMNFSNFETRCYTICEEFPKEKLLKLFKSNEILLFISGCVSIENFMQGLDASKIKRKLIKLAVENPDDEFKEFCSKNPTKTIYWFDRPTSGSTFCHKIYCWDFYLNRAFTYMDEVVLEPYEIRMKLERNELKDKFVFHNVSNQEMLENLITLDEDNKEIFLENIKNNKIKFTEEEDAHDQSPVHFIKYNESKNFIWIRSIGSLSSIRRCVKTGAGLKGKVTSLSNKNEENFHQFDERYFIIADEPGMGKSTTLTSLSMRLDSSWIVRVNLKDCSHAISQLRDSDLSIDKIVDFLIEVYPETLRTRLTKNLLKFSLQQKSSKKIYIFFDGFDEIYEEEINGNGKNIGTSGKDIIIKLIKFLQDKTEAHILVTTREHTKGTLEDNMVKFAMQFKKIENDSQVAFLTNFWSKWLTLRMDKYGGDQIATIEEYARNLLGAASKIFGKDISRFIGIPLQLRMLVEAFAPKVDSIHSNLIDGDHQLGDGGEIYSNYIDRKVEIYLIQKGGITKPMTAGSKNLLWESIKRYHQYFALELLFPSLVKFFPDGKSFERERELRLSDLYCIGIIKFTSTDSQYEFAHRTFAEYFVASFFYDQISNGTSIVALEDFMAFFRSEILTKEEHKIIRLFLNWNFKNISKEEGEEISKIWDLSGKYDDLAKSALKVFAEDNLPNLIQVFFSDSSQFLNSALLDYNDSIDNDSVDNDSVDNDWDVFSVASSPVRLNHDSVDNDSGNNETAMHIAARYGNSEVVECLIKNGASIETATTLGDYPLHLAVTGKHLKTVQCLIEKGADIDVKNLLGETALYLAVKTVLNVAADYGSLDIVKCLIDKGAKIDALTKYDSTALHFAANYDRLDIVKYLIDKGANIDAPSQFGRTKVGETILHLAAENDSLDIVKYVIDKGTNIDALSKFGETALHLAAEYGRLDIVKYLTDKGAKIDVVTNFGETALHWAAKNGSLDIVKCLIDKEAEIDALYKFETALHLAAEYGRLDIVKYLIDKGAKIDVVTNFGETVLHLAAASGNLETVTYLVDNIQANVNYLDGDGNTPLYYATSSNNFEIVKFLVTKGAH